MHSENAIAFFLRRFKALPEPFSTDTDKVEIRWIEEMRNLGRVFVPQPQIEAARQQLEKIYSTDPVQPKHRLYTEQTLDEPAVNNGTATPTKTNIKQTERIPKTNTTATKTDRTQAVLVPHSDHTHAESAVNKVKTRPTQDQHKSNTKQTVLSPYSEQTQTKRRQLSGDSRAVVYREKLEGSLAKLGLGDDAIARINKRAAARLA